MKFLLNGASGLIGKKLVENMLSKGYDLSNLKSNICGRFILHCLLPLKVVCGLIMNYGRFQNLGKTIFRRFFEI